MSYLDRYLQHHGSGKKSSAIAFLASLDHLQEHNPLVANAIIQELKDQRSHLKMIASENFSSLAVQLAMGNLLTDKYAEGYPFHRFYAGCENVDLIEDTCIKELKEIFGCDHAYVQPHSGADANLVAFWAVLVARVQNKEVERLGKKTVDELTKEEYEEVRKLLVSQKIMGLSLNSGGHLTHGYRHNVSAKIMQAVSYDVDKTTGLIDYQVLQAQVKKEKPAILIAGYSAYPRKINFAKMREIADSVGATFIVDMAHFAGLVAGKVFQGDENPLPFAHIVTSTTHKTLRGPRGGVVLCKEEFKEVVNKGCPIVLGGPLPHVLAAKAVAFKEANSQNFQTYAHQIVKNAKSLAEHLLSLGVTITTDGTDNHLLVMNTATSFGLTGRQAELTLRSAFITSNRNSVPFDSNGPWYTSGVRLGTPALTTLGMKEGEMALIAKAIVLLLKNTRPDPTSKAKAETSPAILDQVKQEITGLLRRFPLYPELDIS